MQRSVDLGFLERRWQGGNVHAGFVLGNYYLKGKGVPCDKKKGLHYLRAAAHKGSLRAAIILSSYFADPKKHFGEPKYAAARYWELKSRMILRDRASKGDKWAKNQLIGYSEYLQSSKTIWIRRDLEGYDGPRPWYCKSTPNGKAERY